MEPDTFTDSMDLKVRELLKEVRLDYSPSFTKLVEDTVSANKDGIDKIPKDLKGKTKEMKLTKGTAVEEKDARKLDDHDCMMIRKDMELQSNAKPDGDHHGTKSGDDDQKPRDK